MKNSSLMARLAVLGIAALVLYACGSGDKTRNPGAATAMNWPKPGRTRWIGASSPAKRWGDG